MNQVRQLRQALEMTQQEFAELLRTSQPTLSKWEAGEEPADDSLHFRFHILQKTWEDGLPLWRKHLTGMYSWRLGVARDHMEAGR